MKQCWITQLQVILGNNALSCYDIGNRKQPLLSYQAPAEIFSKKTNGSMTGYHSKAIWEENLNTSRFCAFWGKKKSRFRDETLEVRRVLGSLWKYQKWKEHKISDRYGYPKFSPTLKINIFQIDSKKNVLGVLPFWGFGKGFYSKSLFCALSISAIFRAIQALSGPPESHLWICLYFFPKS